MHIELSSKSELQTWADDLQGQYLALQQQELQLDLTRGKPGVEQLNLSNALDGVLEGNYRDADGVDVRNYGGLVGIREACEFAANVLGSDPDHTVIGGNSSLALMYQTIEFAMNYGLRGKAWRAPGKVKFLCPVPGYDRHFSVCEHLGIGMINVPLTEQGPDMDVVEKLVKSDASIKGIWCVPRFSNPSGVVYSDEVVDRIAGLGKISAPDFLVMWDNAYAVHSLQDHAPALASIAERCKAHDTESNVLQFGSTSKVTFAGAGMSFLASSTENIGALTHHLGYSTIGPDKVNQLRHVRFLRDMDGLHHHMRKHATLLRPRFQAVQEILQKEFADGSMGRWTTPQGGYFILFNSRPGLARTIVKQAADVGVKLTQAGATYPYGRDPSDSDIRLAPTFPTVEELKIAMQAFVLCVKLASVHQKLLES